MRELVDVAMEYITNQIITHKLLPGGILYETVIAEELSISRTPVRQALNTAVSRGILAHSTGKRGYQLSPLSREDMINVFNTRKAIEVQAVIDAARNVNSKEDSCRIEELLAKEYDYLCEKNRIRYANINRLIHSMFVELSGNIYLQTIFEQIFWRTSLYDFHFSDFYSDNETMSQGQYLTSHAEHEKIVEAIFSQNAEYAKLCMEMHLATTINIYYDRYLRLERENLE